MAFSPSATADEPYAMAFSPYATADEPYATAFLHLPWQMLRMPWQMSRMPWLFLRMPWQMSRMPPVGGGRWERGATPPRRLLLSRLKRLPRLPRQNSNNPRGRLPIAVRIDCARHLQIRVRRAKQARGLVEDAIRVRAHQPRHAGLDSLRPFGRLPQ